MSWRLIFAQCESKAAGKDPTLYISVITEGIPGKRERTARAIGVGEYTDALPCGDVRARDEQKEREERPAYVFSAP